MFDLQTNEVFLQRPVEIFNRMYANAESKGT
jgi:hypothetical protein